MSLGPATPMELIRFNSNKVQLKYDGDVYHLRLDFSFNSNKVQLKFEIDRPDGVVRRQFQFQ